MTVGIGIFGVLASYLAHLFLPSPSQEDGTEDLGGSGDLAEIRAELAAVNTRLDAIEAMLNDRAPRRSGSTGTESFGPEPSRAQPVKVAPEQ